MMHPLAIARTAITEHAAIQKDSELARLIAAIMDLDPLKLILEVGSFNGGTLWAWQQICPVVIGVDLPPPGWEETVQLNDLGCPIVCGDSHAPSTLNRLIDLLDGRPVDALFIDGDHSYDGVKADYEMYGPLVRPGGVVAFHDILTHPQQPYIQVNRFWATLDGDLEEFITGPDHWGGIGVIHVPLDPDAAARQRAARAVDGQAQAMAAYGQPRQKATA